MASSSISIVSVHRPTGLIRVAAILVAVIVATLIAFAPGLALAQDPGPTVAAVSQNERPVIGRGFVGEVIEIGDSSITVESKGLVFQVAVTDASIINNPPDLNVGLDGLSVDSVFRVAASVETSVTDENGSLNSGLPVAKKITVIPGKATRTHRRIVVAEKTDDVLKILDTDGKELGLKMSGGDFRPGDNLIMLVQSHGKDNEGLVKGLVNSNHVDARLERFANAATADPDKRARLDALRSERDRSLEDQMNSIADKTGEEFGEMVREAASNLSDETVKLGEPTTATDSNPLPSLTVGLVLLTSILGDGDTPPEISIITPEEGVAVLGILIAAPLPILVKADDDDEVVAVKGLLTANGVSTDLVFEQSGTTDLPGMDWRTRADIPKGTRSFTIEVTATDSKGQTASDKRTLVVAPDAPPSVKIVSPTTGTAVEEGSTIKVEVLIEDDGELTSAKTHWPIVGDLGRASGDNSWPIVGDLGRTAVSAPVVPVLSNPNTNIASNIPPHVFVGGVTLNGSAAPDGTTVSAWVAGGLPGKIVLAATASDDSGNTTVAEVSLELLAQQVLIEETTVVDGNYTLLVGVLQGQSFDGRTVHFRVNGIPARSTGTWLQGGGDELPLTVVAQ